MMTDHDQTLRAIARRLCRNDSDAQDLVHDTYERALRAADRYRDRGNLRGWLVTILYNLYMDRCRAARRARVVALDPGVQPEPAEPASWTSVSDEQVAAALAQLGGEFRRVYELHAAGKSYDEIARTLRIAKATVGTRLLRARRKLRDAILVTRCPTGA